MPHQELPFPKPTDPRAEKKLRDILQQCESVEPFTGRPVRFIAEGTNGVEARASFIILEPSARTAIEDVGTVNAGHRFDFNPDGTVTETPMQGASRHHQNWEEGYIALNNAAERIAESMSDWYRADKSRCLANRLWTSFVSHREKNGRPEAIH